VYPLAVLENVEFECNTKLENAVFAFEANLQFKNQSIVTV
jgi:hypothetical protein